MGKVRLCASIATSVMATAIGCQVGANETISYSYDAKGRLIQVARSGSINDGSSTAYSYDNADNRKALSVSNSSAPPAPTPPTPPPPPPPPPPSGNLPPVANPDNAESMGACSFRTVSVTNNDTDPEGNMPLTVIDASGTVDLFASVVNNSSIQLESTSAAGTRSVTYTVADSFGATAIGMVTVNILGGSGCNNLRVAPPPPTKGG
jgi:Bacterial Ig domain